MLENCVKESGVGAYLLRDDFGSLLFPDQVALSIKSCNVFSQLAAASCLSMLLWHMENLIICSTTSFSGPVLFAFPSAQHPGRLILRCIESVKESPILFPPKP